VPLVQEVPLINRKKHALALLTLMVLVNVISIINQNTQQNLLWPVNVKLEIELTQKKLLVLIMSSKNCKYK